MKIDKPPRLRLKAETWAVPGKEQTLAGLIETLGSRVIKIDWEKGRVLVAFDEQEVSIAQG